ncbi:sugar phosphate isomerase/epimerase family protein [Nocardioides mesophilus]|uniref:Sugar phosphate isomerase/epimerase n=1 Tax=Nocardioides mesophilus TaxID=433659 RepID=A0A7G9RFM2_9ACTN|nr:sugar phosphate isomerase/epimerase [Nocardioides mesophilus]QNN54397.1 sugar phosphate isomerase/epimerase [Nocardioides mesophilus]
MTKKSGPELIATCWLTAGAVAPLSADERSAERIEERVRVAGEAGFTGFGLLHADLVTVRDSMGYAEFGQLIADSPIEYLELEMLVDWFSDGAARESSDRLRRDLLEAARQLPVRHLKAGGDFSGSPWPFETMAAEFRRLSEQAADVGVRVGIEPIAFANIRTPADALRLLETSGHPSGGMVLDVWHLGRLGLPMDTVVDIPVEAIVSTELDDAAETVVGTLLEDTINERMLPGEGVLDVVGFIRAVRATGYDGPWGLEIISRAHRAKPMEQAVHDAVAAAQVQFALADEPPPA